MQKFFNWFKSLPPHLQMTFAMAGFGSFGVIAIAAATTIGRLKFGTPPTAIGTWAGMLILAFLLILIWAIASGIQSLAGRKSRKRSQRLSQDLMADVDRGPVSMDLRAVIKANNEKFAAAVRDMKKNAGLNVYDLPWFIVIGDSGCGKTKMVNESGLTFSLGKPEGYQLGTLNYNWWFTEDAVFIDMAGKLCNPQDDADYKEWKSFLDTVGKGRPGFPINGAICCVSAEHLLQDPPEKLEADANTMLERLRDLQTKLGVTFATHLVVTKCDKVLGFMPFFDRADRDITVKNQMVGWSRPGAFNDFYNPDQFADDFEGLYSRLNDLRVRRLNDEADELELGIAYAFPEQFRELQLPLETYIRTLFPPIKNPKAVKNLCFRGVYFTSATQQGGVILKHLMERLGPEAAENFPPLESLYPRPRPLFVKDLMMRKVFPEQGLVFRNEAQVIRNRKLNTFLKVGGVSMAVLLGLLMGAGYLVITQMVEQPKEHAIAATQPASITSAEATIQKLGTDIDNLSNSGPWPKLLFTLAAPTQGLHRSKPIINALKIARAGCFQRNVLPKVVENANTRLCAPLPSDANSSPSGSIPYNDFKDALIAYVEWYAMSKESPRATLSTTPYFHFGNHANPVTQLASLRKFTGFNFATNCDSGYFTDLQDVDLKPFAPSAWPNPARACSFDKLTIDKALEQFANTMTKWATLDNAHPDPVTKDWITLRDACQTFYKAYLGILDISTDNVIDLPSFKNQVKEKFVNHWDLIKDVKGKLTSPSGTTFAAALTYMRDRAWGIFAQSLITASKSSATPPSAEVEDSVNKYLLADAGPSPTGLDAKLHNQLATSLSPKDEIQLALLPDSANRLKKFADYSPHIIEVTAAFDWLLGDVSPTSTQPSALGAGSRSTAMNTVCRDLAELASVITPNAEAKKLITADEWVAKFGELRTHRPKSAKAVEQSGEADETDVPSTAAKTPPSQPENLRWPDRWKQDVYERKLADLRILAHRARGTNLLNSFKEAMANAAKRDTNWGFGGLTKPTTEWDADAPPEFQCHIDKALNSNKSKPSNSANKPGSPPLNQRIWTYMTREHLYKVAENAVKLRQFLACGEEDQKVTLSKLDFFPQRAGGGTDPSESLEQQCINSLDDSFTKYASDYFSEWRFAYNKANLKELATPINSDNWKQLQGALTQQVIQQLEKSATKALGYLLENTRYVTFHDQKFLEDADSSEEWRHFANIVTVQRKENFKCQMTIEASFASSLPLYDGKDVTPWQTEANKFATTATTLLQNLAKNELASDKLTPKPNQTKIPAIEWTQLKTAANEANLTDEVLCNSVLCLADHAMDLLSKELTSVYVNIQTANKAGQFSQLPYQKEGNCLAYSDFLKMVNSAHIATEHLKEVENSFGTEGTNLHDQLVLGAAERRKFISGCDEWQKFLDQKDSSQHESFELKLTCFDPITEKSSGVDKNVAAIKNRFAMLELDTAQHYYVEAKLSIGLFHDDPPKTDAIAIPVDPNSTNPTQTCYWKWRAVDKPQVQFGTLTSNAPDWTTKPGVNYDFPVRNEFALCWYLQHCGKSDDRKTWYVLHHFAMPDSAKPRSIIVAGIKCELTGQALPETFVPLTTATDSKRSACTAPSGN